jgi:hypothetical protein
MKRITDPDFKYIPACKTNIRLAFDRERQRLAELAAKIEVEEVPTVEVKPLDYEDFEARR